MAPSLSTCEMAYPYLYQVLSTHPISTRQKSWMIKKLSTHLPYLA
ncbi:predicted protein [Plenodomus lingam JN3]|uniref:Predicted protein n=1 Tax=Leptosphaeria maculans (strain JN3 / isolate v23.1.3 / race Av1-4-5-6-7-8) TaxID=985895 RepID=E4ZZ26_LEPMJ|nr:predicted protein [Plenodomus lingam JN3]CBX96461.1 predicted protein [Plenodomus lingam JN3]